MVELNPFLQPIGAPITSNNFVSGYSFDSYNERGAVTGIFIRDASITNAKIGTAAIGTANIGTLSFNEISGGTATLGGTADGDGVLSINDSAGSEVVRGDSDGLTVKTTSGTTFIDGSGLISTANFTSASTVSLNNTRTTSSESFVDVSNTTLTFTLGRTSNVLFLLYGDFANYPTDENDRSSEYVALNIDGTLYPDSSNGFGNVQFLASSGSASITTAIYTWSGHYLASLGSGGHTAKLQFAKAPDTPVTTVDARVINTGLTYLILGS